MGIYEARWIDTIKAEMEQGTMTDLEGPIYTKYFAQFSVVVWCREELFITDSFKKQQIHWNMKDVMSSAEEMKMVYDTLRELELNQESRVDVSIGDGVVVSVHHPVPLAVIKAGGNVLQMDTFSWWILMETCEELRNKYGDCIERSRLCEEFMKIIYSCLLQEMVVKIAAEKCHGCQVDHPSQMQHDVCIMMDTEEKVTLCLSEAIERVDHLQATRMWGQSLAMIDPRPQWEDISKWASMDYRLFWLNSMRKDLEKRIVLKMGGD